MNNTVENKKRMYEQDVAKGIAMLFVVLCHAMPVQKLSTLSFELLLAL